jgi:putative ABC transport system permease protein
MASFLKLRNTNPGFRSENILTMQISSLSQSQEGSQQQASLEEILARIGALPQVESVGIVNNLPLAGGVGWGRFDFKQLLEQPTTADLTRPIEVDQRIASPGYFGTLGIPFLKGRTFSEDAASGVVQEIIMSKSLAQRLWPDGNAIGRRLHMGPRSQPWVPVVGIVGDIRHSSLRSDPRFTLYRAYSEQRYGTLVARTKSDPLSVAADVRKIILSADKNTLIFQVRSMEEILADSVAQPRFYASLTGLFATLALLMAAVGVYGVISYSVGRRMKEFGIRIALGAEPSSILGIVIREGVVTTVIGIVIGIALSLAVTRLLSNQLFGVAPEDPRIFGLTSLILMLSALAACWVPAWRAARVDPAITLRCE